MSNQKLNLSPKFKLAPLTEFRLSPGEIALVVQALNLLMENQERIENTNKAKRCKNLLDMIYKVLEK